MSNISKISIISNIIYNPKNKNSIFLKGKTAKEIMDKKENFEQELEDLYNSLSSAEGKNLLDLILSECEKGQVSFVDSTGSIKKTKINSIINDKIEKNKGNEKLENEQIQIDKEKAQMLEFDISKETEKFVEDFFGIYSSLTDEDKIKLIRENFSIRENASIDNVKLQMDLSEFVRGLRGKGYSVEQIKREIQKEKRFDLLSREQKEIDEEGKTLMEKQMELEQEEIRIKAEIDDLNTEENNLHSSENKKKRSSAEEEVKKIRAKKEELSEKTGVYNVNVNSLQKKNFTLERTKDTEKILRLSTSEEHKEYEDLSFDKNKIKTIKDINKLLEEGVSKEEIEEALALFSELVVGLDEEGTIEDLEKLIVESKDDINPNVAGILELLPKLQFDKNLEEILSSEEERINLMEQLTNIFERDELVGEIDTPLTESEGNLLFEKASEMIWFDSNEKELKNQDTLAKDRKSNSTIMAEEILTVPGVEEKISAAVIFMLPNLKNATTKTRTKKIEEQQGKVTALSRVAVNTGRDTLEETEVE